MVSHPSALDELNKAKERVRHLWAPPPDLTVSQWAEANRIMPKGTTSRPGPWRSEVYQRGIMDALCDPLVNEVVWMKSTQVGASEILNNIIGYFIDLDPKPMMMVQPTETNAKDYGRKRITPMIQACPKLRDKVREAKTRQGGNTLTLKEFPGGFLKLTGANSGAGLRSDPVPIVAFDEVDGYPDDVNGEGDPIEIGSRRTDQFPDFKLFKVSTPAKPKGLSRIERDYERSDQRRFHVPCPHCGHEQVLWWRDPRTKEHRLVWEVDADGQVVQSSVRYVCANCKKGITERHKQGMLDRGRWIAAHPGRPVVGFHINALYSPWKENWHTLAQEWVDAQENREALKAFINLRLGETWEEQGETQDKDSLKERLAPYAAEVPGNVACLTMAVDVQDNRLEAVVKGWAPGEESYLIAYEVFWGDPSADPGVWEDVEALRTREWTRADGLKMQVAVTVVDSGGHHTDAVYDFVQPRQNLRARVFAVKGVEFNSKPVLAAEGTTKRSAVRLYTIATHQAKDRIFSRLKIPQPGPGYMHLPEWTTDEYLAQLTGEKRIVVTNKRTRTKKTVWVKTHTRNEALDLEVYNLGALFILQTYLAPGVFRDLAALLEATKTGGAVPQQARGRRFRSQGIG